MPLAFASPLLNRRADNVATEKYLVVLKPGITAATHEAIKGIDSSIVDSVNKDYIYDLGNFKGFASALSNAQVDELKSHPQVAYVEKDGKAHTMQEELADQTNAPWGLGRISHRQAGATDYVYDASAGQGTCAYVIDTGIYTQHPEFEGRATFVKNFAGSGRTDDNGHGTHVAGTIGSKTYGVAKKTNLYAIKVLDANGSGSWSDVISGINLAATDAKQRSCPNGVVVNMSLGGDFSQAVNDAVAASVDAGLFFAVAAGNEASDISTTSPASEPKAFSVGATDSTDNMASFSNFGATLGVFAPGVDVLSTWNNGKTNTISGTSMATPHVVGLGAYLLGLNGAQSPASLGSLIQQLSTKNTVSISVTGATGTPNRLAFNGAS